ncbi:hypothetical protein TKK_0006468 [Trichogramma kaykai]
MSGGESDNPDPRNNDIDVASSIDLNDGGDFDDFNDFDFDDYDDYDDSDDPNNPDKPNDSNDSGYPDDSDNYDNDYDNDSTTNSTTDRDNNYCKTAGDNPIEEVPPPVVIDPELLINFNRTLILQIDHNSLWAQDVDSHEGKFIVRNSDVPFDNFDLYANKNLYLGGTRGSESVNTIRSSNTAFKDLRWPTIDWHARSIAVDAWGRNVYVVDDVGSKVDVIDMMAGYQSIVLPSLDDPVDIALDPSTGQMFVLQWASILRSNMDGTLLRAIISDTIISAFAIETKNKRVFWVENLSLQRSDYDGNNITTVFNFTSRVKSLAALEDKLFWVISNSISNSGYLWSCEYSDADASCQNSKKQYFVDNIVALKVYDLRQELANPCATSNCGQLCVVSGDASTTCACTLNWQPDPSDSTDCRPVQDYLLYVEGDIVKGVSLDSEAKSFMSAMTPFKLTNVSLVPQQTIAFDYDSRQRRLYYRNEGSIYSVDMTANTKEILLRNASKSGPQSLAVDWVTGNIFYPTQNPPWAQIGTKDPVNPTNIMFYNRELNGNMQERSVFRFIYNEEIESIALDPNRGHIYFATIVRIGLTYRLHRMNQNSSDIIDLKEASHAFASLCIDEKDRRLYWIHENAVQEQNFSKVSEMEESKRSNGPYEAWVYYIDLNDLEPKRIKINELMLSLDIDRPITSIKVYDDWLYLANNVGIWRMPKQARANPAVNATEPSPTRLLTLNNAKNRVIQGMYLYSEQSQYIDRYHPCAVSNGNCAGYCLAVPYANNKNNNRVVLQRICV